MQIDSLTRRGEIEADPSRRGVWRVAGAPRTRHADCAAAALAAEAVLSHTTAAWVLGLPFGAGAGQIHVTRSDRDHVTPLRGVRVRRVPLAEHEVDQVDGLPVTTVRRTTVDCLRDLPFQQAVTVFDRARQQGWLSLGELADDVRSGPKRWGNVTLRRLIEHCAAGDAESERRLHQILRDAGITGWAPNAKVDMGFAVLEFDVVFRHLRLIIEVDGFRVHTKTDRFQTDRTRQNAASALGWSILRFTWHDIVNRPTYVVLTVKAMIARLSG